MQLAIADFFDKHGLHGLTLQKLQAHISTFEPDRKPLRLNDISTFLKTSYHLDFKKLDPA